MTEYYCRNKLSVGAVWFKTPAHFKPKYHDTHTQNVDNECLGK